jgi:ribonuclease D
LKIKLHKNDLPGDLDLGPVVAIDSETLGLNPFRDRLCLVQLSAGDGVCHAVQFERGAYAAPLVRTYTDKHGLKDLVKELLGVDLSKEQQSSDWGAPELSERQLAYAANDVAYLHRLKESLDSMLAREGRTELAEACFDFLPARVELDLGGWAETDIFEH